MAESDYFPSRSSEPENREEIVRLIGNGTGTPTKGSGRHVTLARSGVGVYTATFTESPGAFVRHIGPALQSSTGADLKNFSAVYKDYNATTRTIEIQVYNAAGAATDLSSVQSLSFGALFKKAGAGV